MPVHLHPTAYGPAARDVLHDVVRCAQTSDPLAPVTLLVPTNLAGTLARRSLARRTTAEGVLGVAGLTVLTVDRLAELLAAPALTVEGRRPITGTVLSAAWRRSLAEAPGLLAPVAQHPATVTALVGAHRLLRDLTPEALSAVEGTGSLTAQVVRLHRTVVASLRKDWYDTADLRAAAVTVLEFAGRLDHLGTVVVHLPQELDRSAAALVATLALHRPVHVVTGLTGQARADAAVIASTARVTGGPLPAVAITPPTATRVRHASDSDDEARGVVREVVQLLRKVPAHRIAVLYGTAAPYARLFHDHMAAAQVEINGPGVRATADRAHPRALLLLLQLAEDGVDRAGLFRMLAGSGLLDASGALVPGSKWERISRRAGVVSADDWSPRLQHYAAGQRGRAAAERIAEAPREALVQRYEDSAAEAERLLAFVLGLQASLAEGRNTTGWSALSAWALQVFTGLIGDEAGRSRLPEAERRAGDVVERILRGLEGLDALEPGADLAALREVVERELSEDRPRTGRSGTGVLVAPLSASVGLDADHVFVVGLAEGLYPARVRDDALLPDRSRQAAGGELPAVRERLDRQYRHLLAALASAPDVTATFPRGDLRRSGERLPSRWLLSTLRALTNQPELDATTWHQHHAAGIGGSPSFAATITSTEVPSSEQEWRVRALAGGDDLPADEVLQLAQALLAARHSDDFTRYDGNVSAHAGALPDPADATQTVSPTSLESWVSCPHAYFLQRVLGVEPVEQPEELLELSPADRGNVLHEALDRFFAGCAPDTPTPTQRWSAEQRSLLRTIGEQVADEYEQRGLTGHPTLWARDRVQLLDDLLQVLDQDDAVRPAAGRRQVRSELVFGRKGQPPVEVVLPDGRVVRLAGSADRVDECADGSLVVTDYKSGKPDKFKGLSEDDPDKAGSKLQLPVYAYAARQALDRPEAEVRAEYWFIGKQGRGTQIGYPLTEQVQRRYAEVLAIVTDGIAGGLFPANVPEDRPWSSFAACPYCDPDGLGAKERRVQWQRKKSAPALRHYLGLTEPDEEQR